MEGYVTEKLFFVWGSPAVPIYRGAPDVDKYIPAPHSFINAADFPTVEVLADCIP